MTELKIMAHSSGKKPDYRKTAAALLERCRAFYQDPESEREYLEWKEKRSGKHEKKAAV